MSASAAESITCGAADDRRRSENQYMSNLLANAHAQIIPNMPFASQGYEPAVDGGEARPSHNRVESYLIHFYHNIHIHLPSFIAPKCRRGGLQCQWHEMRNPACANPFMINDFPLTLIAYFTYGQGY